MRLRIRHGLDTDRRHMATSSSCAPRAARLSAARRRELLDRTRVLGDRLPGHTVARRILATHRVRRRREDWVEERRPVPDKQHIRTTTLSLQRLIRRRPGDDLELARA